MHRLITGATGLIGRHLVEHWLKQGHTLTVVSRTEKHIKMVFGDRVQAVTWDTLTSETIGSAELIVNLAGESIGGASWNKKQKKAILHSRVDNTQKLAALLCELEDNAPRLFNASAIGVYGLQKQTDDLPPPLDEGSPIDWEHPTDFLSLVGRRWEKAAGAAVQKGLPVIFARFGVVLAKEGGALPDIVRPFRFYLGGKWGTGRQPFSWVAMDDLLSAFDFLADQPAVTGPVNIVSPGCVNQAALAETLGRVLGRPAKVKLPAFLIKLLFGEMGRELLLEGQHVYPKRLLEMGFKFRYADLESALNHILK